LWIFWLLFWLHPCKSLQRSLNIKLLANLFKITLFFLSGLIKHFLNFLLLEVLTAWLTHLTGLLRLAIPYWLFIRPTKLNNFTRLILLPGFTFKFDNKCVKIQSMSEINKSERLVCLLIPFRIDSQFDIIVSSLMFFKFKFHITFFVPTRNISDHDSCTLFLTNYEKMLIYWSSLTKVISCNGTCLRILLLNTISCWYRIVQRVWSWCWKFLIIKWLFRLLYFSWCV